MGLPLDEILEALERLRPGVFAGAAGDELDVRVTLALTADELARGCRKGVTFPRRSLCRTCAGSGSRPGSDAPPCAPCAGSGRVVKSLGSFRFDATCERCRGQGALVSHPCPDCVGGTHERTARLTVRVPAACDPAAVLRLAGQGHQRRGRRPGDALLTLEARATPAARVGDDAVSECVLTRAQANEGARLRAPSPAGEVELEVPAGARDGQELVLLGEGFARAGAAGAGYRSGAPRGSLRVRLRVPAAAGLGLARGGRGWFVRLWAALRARFVRPQLH